LKNVESTQLIRCTEVIEYVNPPENYQVLPDDTIEQCNLPLTVIKCNLYEFQVSCVTVSTENTKTTLLGTRKSIIPFGLEYEQPIMYTDKSIRSRRDVDTCPCTFVAMYQYEAAIRDGKTSIKRYFTNHFEDNNKRIGWKVFCGRLFSFEDETDDAQAAAGEDENIQFTDDDYDQSRTSSYSDDTLSLTSGSTRSPTGSSESADKEDTTSRSYTDDSIITNGSKWTDERLTSTLLIKFQGRNSRIFINIFIIFHHWARHDQHKGDDADRALWDPNPNHTGFDVFYPKRVENTRLRPWMFTVTQALRDWICDLVEIHSYTASLAAFNGSVQKRIEDETRTGFNEIINMFNDSYRNLTTAHSFHHTHIDPIFAAQDWKKDNHSELVARAKAILSAASKKAFPTELENGLKDEDQSGIDITENREKVEELSMYIYENAKNMTKISDLSMYSLSEISIKAMSGFFLEKDSTSYDILKKIPHTPILFPQFLDKGDILGVYSELGCTLVYFQDYFHDTEDALPEQIEQGSRQGPELVAENRRRGRFSMKSRRIRYKLHEDDDDILTLTNFIDVYLLVKVKRGGITFE
jgi:hypothetical protein